MRRYGYILLTTGLSAVLALPGLFGAMDRGRLDEPALAHAWSAHAGISPADGAVARSARPSDLWQAPSYAELFDDDDDDDDGCHLGHSTSARFAHADDRAGNPRTLSAPRRSLLALAPKTGPPLA